MNIKLSSWLNAAIKICILYLSSFLIFADTHITHSSASEALLAEAQQKQLWTKQEWLNLLHYKGETNALISQVDDDLFFNARDGKSNPQHELMASLQAFYQPNASEPDAHPQCRFVARLHWLQKQLPQSLVGLPNVQCPEYEKWRVQVPGNKASLIFPAYHLNSPSSMFGHTLLRIDPADDVNHSSWLSMAVNFGANIQASDNSLAFAIKGLAGGYSGTFIVTPYYKKIKEYNRQENRDIWEYPLNLTPQETEKMVQHLWELKGINFDYYFFDENCSYRLLELLEVARPNLRLTEQFGLTAIPVDTVRTIDNANLITDVVYRPSQASTINYLLNQLSVSEKNLVLQLSDNANLINSTAFEQINPTTQNIMLDAAYRYLRYQQNDDGRSDKNARNSFMLLNAINQLDSFESARMSFSEQQQPEKGHLSKRLQLSAGSNTIENRDTNISNRRNFAQLQFRMSFHGLEDNINGFLEGAQINIGSISARAYQDELQLQQLDFIDIFSISPRNQFFQPLSWRVYTGLEQQYINGKERLTGHVTGGAGVAYEPWKHGFFYLLASARLESNSQFTRPIEPALGINSGWLQHFSFGTAQLELSAESFLNSETRQRIKFTQNIPLARNHALQLSVNFQQQRSDLSTYQTSDTQLSYHYFFH